MKDIQTIAVVGLGYVGLPLVVLAARKGYEVIGLDIDKQKLSALSRHESYVDDISNAELEQTKAAFTSNFARIKDAQAVFICVPTPVFEDKSPDLGPVKGAVSAIAPHLQKGTLVVLESTVNPGISNDVVVPLLEKLSKKKVGKDIYLAHCPERINPGDPHYNVSNINRVVGADSEKELAIAKKLYESLIDAEIRPMASLKEAEAVKVVENSFRDVNIAFVNELAMSFHKSGIDVENVINGAATKPFAFMPHYPGCGVGGHCIPVDPYYLIEYARGYGFEHQFLSLARSINNQMPVFTVELLDEALNQLRKPLNGSKVALLGLSYKPNVGDRRESPALKIKEQLEERKANAVTYDPHLPGESSAGSLKEALQHADAIVLATAHQEFIEMLDAETLASCGVQAVIDGRNALKHLKPALKNAGIIYKGIGV